MSPAKAFSMDGYVDVAERIRLFREKYPDGSLQPANLEEPFKIVGNGEDGRFVVYVAAAYRHPEDQRPGVGVAWEPFPGKTPYTKDSELQNAETSAWGRAIVASLAADTQKIASTEEVRNRQGGEDPNVATVKQKGAIKRIVAKTGEMPLVDGEVVWPLPDDLTKQQASAILDQLNELPVEPLAHRAATLREQPVLDGTEPF